jgi:hypothetical protein
MIDDVRKCPRCGQDSLIEPIIEGAPWICITEGCDHKEGGDGTRDAVRITD